MGIAVLGPLEVDGRGNGLAPRDRVVLSALVVSGRDPLTTEALADALWGDHPPASWQKVVHGCVARLRKLLGPAAIESGAAGYRLTVTEAELDCRRFERQSQRARDALDSGDPERASSLVQEALDLWRGRALADLEEWGPARVEAARLQGLRTEAEELHVEAAIRAGHGRAVLETARALVARAPLRERRWALLARALHQTGRQAEALAALRRARAKLADELGLDPGHELAELEELLLRQDPSLDAVPDRPVSDACPYRGLLPYDTWDADSFFGREAEVDACLRRLRDTGVLAVVGPSGVGKSSLVRAGVVASLAREGVPVLVTTPGSRPGESLSALRSTGNGRQVLVVDQAEEATACPDPDERACYLAAVTGHVAAGGSLVLALRADHLGDLAAYPEISRTVERGLYLLGPMTEPALRSAIEEPARQAGLRLEPGLVDLLMRDSEGEPAALPLLSHVLREIWSRREGPTLTVDGYRATGGIREAVSRTAESLYETLDDSRRSQLRSVLLRLVLPMPDGDPVRGRVLRTKLAVDEEHGLLLEQLVAARLVSVDGDSVQIAHEALVRVWPRLRAWLDDDVEGLRLFQHLTGAADTWEAMGRPDSELYRGTRLARTLEWSDQAQPDLSDHEAAFLAASSALAEREALAAEAQAAREHQVNRRLRAALASVALLLVAAVLAGLLAVVSADRAGRERDTAALERDRAAAAAALAETRRAGAQGGVHEDLATGLLLAAQSLALDDSPQARENLGTVLTRAGARVAVHDFGRATGRTGTAWFSSVAASPAGGRIVGCLWNGGTRMFDSKTLKLLPFQEDTPECSSLAFSPDGTRLVVAGSSFGGFRLYDVDTGAPSQRQPGGLGSGVWGVLYTPHNHVDVAFSADGRRLASQLHRWQPEGFARVGRALVWDTSEPDEPLFDQPMPRFSHVALSPAGHRLYVATRTALSLRVYDVGSGRILQSRGEPGLAAHGASALALSPDGSSLAVAVGNQVTRYDTRTLRTRERSLTGHTGPVVDITYSHRGRLIATASEDGTAAVWDALSGHQLHSFAEGGPTALAFSHDDRRLFTVGGAGVVSAWGLTGAGRELALGEAPPGPDDNLSTALPSPDGRIVAQVRAGRLWFEHTRTGDLVSAARRLGPRGEIDDPDLVWSPDSRRLLTVAGEPLGPWQALTVWDPAKGTVLARAGLEKRWAGVRASFSHDSAYLFVHDESFLHTLDPATLRPVSPKVAVPMDSGRLVSHPDGTVLVLHRYAGSVRRVNPRTGDLVDSATGVLASDDVGAVLSPDGQRMLVSAPGVRARLLDLDSWEFVGPDSPWQWGSPAFAPDGSQYAIAVAGRIRLWDGRTGEYLASLPLPAGVEDFAVTYRPDSSALIVAATDGRTWVVDTSLARWADRACSIAGRNLTRAEWEEHLPSLPYEPTCPQWPSDT